MFGSGAGVVVLRRLEDAIVLFDAATVYVALRALSEGAQLPSAYAAYVLATIAGVASVLPAGLGVFEGGTVGTLVALGIAVEPALAATLLLRVLTLCCRHAGGAAHPRRGRSARGRVVRACAPRFGTHVPEQDAMLRRTREIPGRARLTPTDAAWYRLEHRGNPVDVTAVLAFDGALPEPLLLDRLEQRLLAHPRFCRRVVAPRAGIGPPRWEDEPGFSIAGHLRHARVSDPGGRQELEALVGELMSAPFDWSRSPWRAVLVDGLAQGSALVVQVHHCVGDGFALMEILLSLADDDPHARPERTRVSAWPFPGPIRARDVPRLVIGGSLALARFLRLSFDPATSLRGERGGSRRASWSRPIPLESLKARARASGAKINDVLLAAVTGAIRRYLNERGEPTRPLRAVVPVNLRPPDVPVDLEQGNWFGLVWVDLPVHQPDRVVRDRAVRETIARLKHSMEALASLATLEVMGRVPVLAERGIEALFARKASLVVTNVPGPRRRLHVVGVPLREIVFWVPHPLLSLGVSLLSYAGEVRVGVRADSSVVPHPERIVALIEDELDPVTTPPRAPMREELR